MSDLYGPANDGESIATVHAALDAGITLLDTGDCYGMGHNELLIREALKGRPRDRVVISVKFGALRDARGASLGVDAGPVAVRNFMAYTLRRLGTDYVDVYRPGRLDPSVPIEETVGAIADLVKQGPGTSGSRKWAPRCCGGRSRCTLSATCRSSTRSRHGEWKGRFCRRLANRGSASPPTGCSPGGC